MKEYLLSVIGAVILSAIVVAVLPEGKTAGMIKTVSRLICILMIISPVLRFFQSGNLSVWGENLQENIFSETVIEAEDSFIKYYSEMRIRETEAALEKEILQRYDLIVEVVLFYEYETERVGAFYESDKIKIMGIHIKLKQESKEEVIKEMWEYMTENYCKEVLIE